MIKKLFFTIFVTSITLALFTGCPRPSDDQTHLILNVESDYSQMIISWVWHYGLDNQFEDTKYFVYLSKENDTAELSEPIYSGKDCITYHTVDEPGHYYVWVKAGENGSFSDPAEIDVSFIKPANIEDIEQTSTGIKLSYSIANEPETRTIYGSYAKILYKNTIDEDWIENEYDDYFYRNSSEFTKSFNFLEDGNYIFKIIVTDRYDTEIPSEETFPVSFKFDSEKYGHEPTADSGYIKLPSSEKKRELTGDVEYYYFNAIEGNSYVINFLNASNFKSEYSYFGEVDQTILVDTYCHILIAGAPSETAQDILDNHCFGIYNNNTETFTCHRNGYYVIRIKKFMPSPLTANSYNTTYYLDITEIPQQ